MWECLSCGHVWWDQSPAKCQFCLDTHLIYREVPIEDEDLMIRGHADGLVLFEERKHLLEIKSIGSAHDRDGLPQAVPPVQGGQDQRSTSCGRRSRSRSPSTSARRRCTCTCSAAEEIDVEDIIFIYEFKAQPGVKAFTIGYRPEAIATHP